MRARQDPPPELLRLALHQAGTVSAPQAREAGLGPNVVARLVREQRWFAIARGVYATSPHPSWDGLAWGGFLVGGEQSRLGPSASAHLHGLDPQPPLPIDVLVPVGTRARVDGPWVFSRERPGARGPARVGSPPRLSAEDTVLDMAAQGDESEVVRWVTTAVQQRRTDPRRLLVAMGHRARYRHRRLLQDMLADVGEGAESALELRYLRDVERAHGLPAGRRQRPQAGLSYRSDVRYDPYGVLVELDGRDGHTGTGRFRDMRRDNRFALLSYRTLRFGWFDVVGQPCVVAAQVWNALSLGGWVDVPTRCRRCERLDERSWSLLP